MAALINNLGGPEGFGERTFNENYGYEKFDLSGSFSSGIELFGDRYDKVGISTNGFIYFNDNAITPGEFSADTIETSNSSTRIFAPFWSDIDTSQTVNQNTSPGGNSQGSNSIYFHEDSVNGIITITWDDVKFNPYVANPDVNAFQLRLIKVGDQGDFDVEFRYENIDWINPGGLYDHNALVGYSSAMTDVYYELPVSGTNAMRDIENQHFDGSNELGVVRLTVRDGQVTGNYSDSETSVDPVDYDYGPEDDLVILQRSAILSKGAGDDVYIVGATTLAPDSTIQISDNQGNNTLQLIEGVTITSARIASNSLMLETSNEASITILSASTFDFEIGGTPLTGEAGTVYSFNSFAEEMLNSYIPVSGITTGEGFTVGSSLTSNGIISIAAGSTDTYQANNSRTDIFTLDLNAAQNANNATQPIIEDFDINEDIIRILNADSQDYTTSYNPFEETSLLSFGSSDGGDLIALQLEGVTSPDQINVMFS